MVAIKETSMETDFPGHVFGVPAPHLELQSLYSDVMQVIRKRLSLFVWQGFFEPLSPLKFENDVLSIAAPSSFHRDWIEDHYVSEITGALTQTIGRSGRVKIETAVVMDTAVPLAKPKIDVPSDLIVIQTSEYSREQVQKEYIPETAPVIAALRKDGIETGSLNPNNTFDSFVPGPSNQMAFAACNAVSEQPGNQYSPLFLFGPVGIGKTHLLHAIGLATRAKHPGARILYMSAEQWVNAYIQAIRERRFEEFRRRFRLSCDILLIDDIQFLAGKDASQDEFFHTFNALHQAHKQIVVTSDKYPHEIQGLEERLQTRLSWGLIADIRPPEIETRIAILYKKAETCNIALPHDVAHFLAMHVASSVRELEGALVRLSAFSKITKSEISLAQAKEYLSPVFRRKDTHVSPEKICDSVASYYDLSSHDLKGKSRQKQIALARQIAMVLCRSHLSMSLPEIGRAFGNRDHTTVLSSLRKIEDMRESDIGIQTVISRIEKSIFDNR